MSKYLIEFTRSAASALLEYNESGYLVKYELTPGSFEKAQFEYFAERFPSKEEHIQIWLNWKVANVKIRKVQEDLSFENFYNTYAHKVSKKSRAEAIWSKMPDTERAKAIKFIQVYDVRLRSSGVNKKYPETYLNTMEWNN